MPHSKILSQVAYSCPVCRSGQFVTYRRLPGENGTILRVREGGEVVDEIATQRTPYACMLGGADGRTLFVCTAESAVPDECRAKPRGSIETIRAETSRAGIP